MDLKALCSSSLPSPAFPGQAWFILAPVAISSPSTTNSCLQKQLALFPVMLEASACMGGTVGQYDRFSHLIRNWVDASPTSTLCGPSLCGGDSQCPRPLWWGHRKVLFRASLTKGRHCCLYPRAINYCFLPSHCLNHISLKSLHSAQHLGPQAWKLWISKLLLHVILPASFHLLTCRFCAPLPPPHTCISFTSTLF